MASEPKPAERRPSGSKSKLFDILVRRGVIQANLLHDAEEAAKNEGVRIEKYLVDQNMVPAAEMTLALADYLQMSPISLAHFKSNAHLVSSIPEDMLIKHCIMPVARAGKHLTVAMADPFDLFAVEELHMQTGLEITPLVASEKEVKTILDQSFTVDASGIAMEDIMKSDDDMDVGDGQDEESKASLEQMMESAEDAPVIRMVNMILIEALRIKAADICIEPQVDHVQLRYKVDGVMRVRPRLPKNLKNAIISRIKILADLDIGEQRIPQDGRFRIHALGKTVDLRVSILPTIFGGRVVMRVLDKNALFGGLSSLGLDTRSFEQMSYALEQPHGIVLVTGPTGSGKTTTLYSCLQELNKPETNIVTCEDPPEYQLAGINQVRINTEVGLTFASALRAILRQDPNVVLIGEIRDLETCEIAIKAAGTGHLVLSTLHTNDAAGAITRILDMGIEPFLIASNLVLTQAQRLYRKLCPNCKKETTINKEVLEMYKVSPSFFDGFKVYGPQGCPKCHNSGYSGRASIMEVLPIDDEIRAAILRQATATDIRAIGIRKGMITLLDGAMQRVRDGLTSVEVGLKVAGAGE